MQLGAALRRARAAAALAPLALFSSGDLRAEDCARPADALTSLGRALSDGRRVSGGSLAPLYYAEPGERVRYVRLMVRPVAIGAAWQLLVRDPELRIIDTLSSDAAGSQAGLWTRRLYSATGVIYLDLEAPAQAQIEVARAIVMPEEAKNPYYSTQKPGVYAFKPLHKARSEARRLGDNVGFLNISRGSESWCCSGVAAGSDILLTNWHCGGDPTKVGAAGVWSKEVCEGTFIDFSWDEDAVDREFTCAEVLDSNEANDFVLLRVRPLRGSDRLRAPTLRKRAPAANEPLQIVHHPACRPKQLSEACSIRDARVEGWRSGAGGDFTYPCDTEGGSSGAPVFDGDGRLIGLHHLGFGRKSDGQCDRLNKAVGIEGILEAMQPAYAKPLRQLMKD